MMTKTSTSRGDGTETEIAEQRTMTIVGQSREMKGRQGQPSAEEH